MTTARADLKTELTNGKEVDLAPEFGFSPFHFCYLNLPVEDRTLVLEM